MAEKTGTYIVEVRTWIKQVRPGDMSGNHEMSLEEAATLRKSLKDDGVAENDVQIRKVK